MATSDQNQAVASSDVDDEPPKKQARVEVAVKSPDEVQAAVKNPDEDELAKVDDRETKEKEVDNKAANPELVEAPAEENAKTEDASEASTSLQEDPRMEDASEVSTSLQEDAKMEDATEVSTSVQEDAKMEDPNEVSMETKEASKAGEAAVETQEDVKAAEAEEQAKDEACEDQKKAKAEPNSARETSAPAAPSASGEMWYKVLGPLHLNLNLKTGNVYAASDLRSRCAGNREKTRSLEKFFADPRKLLPVERPAAASDKRRGRPPINGSAIPKATATHELPAAKKEASAIPVPKVMHELPAAKSKAPAEKCERQLVTSPERRKSAETEHPKPVNEEPAMRFVAGQIVWHKTSPPSSSSNEQSCWRPASVVTLPSKPGQPHVLRYINSESTNPEKDDGGEGTFEAAYSDLKPFDIKDILRVEHSSGSQSFFTRSSQASQVPPAVRDRNSDSFDVGQIVWYRSSKRPCWPAIVLALPELIQDSYSIQLFRASDGDSASSASKDGEIISTSGENLLKMEEMDMPAFANVMRVVQDALEAKDRKKKEA
jgi:hypothetical protein